MKLGTLRELAVVCRDCERPDDEFENWDLRRFEHHYNSLSFNVSFGIRRTGVIG